MPDQHAEAQPTAEASRDSLRLRLKPAVPTTDFVDGAWWPRSRDLAAEVPGLLTELTYRVDVVALVGYHRDAWEAAPDELDIAGHAVGLEGFTSSSPATVLVIGTAGERVTLLVVPPDTAESEAQQLLADGGRPDGDSSPIESGPEAAASTAHSLDDLTTRLARVHGETDPHRTALIGSWVEDAARQFTHARVQVFVPILVEHVVRSRLRAARQTS